MATVVFLTSSSASTQSWTIPADFSTTANTIEIVGTGLSGSGATSATGGTGGGGGGYGKIANWAGTGPAAFFLQIVAGGRATWFGPNGALSTTADISVAAPAGAGGPAGTSPSGAYTVSPANAGGAPGSGDAAAGGGGGGGGGSAGPNGVGTAGSNATSATGGNGGQSDGTSGPAGGTGGASAGGTGNPGSANTDWTQTSPVATAGPGSGGGGGGGNSGHAAHGGTGGVGSTYGSGGGGGGSATGSGTTVQGTGGGGGQPIIVITYTPVVTTPVTVDAHLPAEIIAAVHADALGLDEFSFDFRNDAEIPSEFAGALVITVVNIGNAQSLSVSSVSITVPAGGVPAGSLIAVAANGLGGTTGTTYSVSDTAGNTYAQTQKVGMNGSTTSFGFLFTVQNCLALVSGNTITLTASQIVSALGITALYATDVALSGAIDQSATAFGNTTTPTAGPITPTKNNEVVLGWMASNTSTNASPFPLGGGFSTPFTLSSSTNVAVGGGNLVQTTAAAATFSGTLHEADVWAAGVVSFFQAVPPTPIIIDGILSSESLRAGRYDDEAPSEFVSQAAYDLRLPAELLSKLTFDDTAPSEFGYRLRGDATSPIELTSVVHVDGAPLLEASTAYQSDGRAAFESLSHLVNDASSLTAEFLRGVLLDRALPSEFLSVLRRDVPILNEFGGAILVTMDNRVPFEAGATTIRDALMLIESSGVVICTSVLPDEALAQRLTDARGLSEFSQTLRGDSLVPGEFFVVGLKFDGVLPNELLLGRQIDGRALSENFATVQRDVPAPFELLSQQLRDGRVPSEVLQGLVYDGRVLSDLLAQTRSDALTPTEWRGAIAVATDAHLLIEWSTSLGANSNLSLEALGSARFDNVLPSEFVAQSIIHAPVLFESSGQLLSTSAVPLATLASIITDGRLPIEVLQGVVRDATIPIEYGLGLRIVADATIPLEWLLKRGFDNYLPFEIFIRAFTINPLYILTANPPRNLLFKDKGRFTILSDNGRNRLILPE